MYRLQDVGKLVSEVFTEESPYCDVGIESSLGTFNLVFYIDKVNVFLKENDGYHTFIKRNDSVDFPYMANFWKGNIKIATILTNKELNILKNALKEDEYTDFTKGRGGRQ